MLCVLGATAQPPVSSCDNRNVVLRKVPFLCQPGDRKPKWLGIGIITVRINKMTFQNCKRWRRRDDYSQCWPLFCNLSCQSSLGSQVLPCLCVRHVNNPSGLVSWDHLLRIPERALPWGLGALDSTSNSPRKNGHA